MIDEPSRPGKMDTIFMRHWAGGSNANDFKFNPSIPDLQFHEA